MALQKNQVKLKQYSKKWSVLYKTEVASLKVCLNPDDYTTINHIGSTAIKNISAKPIIDILIGVQSLKDTIRLKSDLKKCNYDYKSEDVVPNRLFFTKHEGSDGQVYLHIAEITTDYYKDKLLFRDYLNHNLKVAKEYDDLKKKLAKKHAENRDSYTEAKMEFIVKVVQQAKKPR